MTGSYSIAGCLLRLEGRGGDLKNLDGFIPFRVDEDPDMAPQLTLNTETSLTDLAGHSDFTILDTFPLENIACTFARSAEGYGFRMVMADGKIVLLWCPIVGKIMTSNICVDRDPDRDPDPTAMRFMLWMAYGLGVLREGGVAIHSSVVVHDGRAVMFLGESGTGKSTHTELWLKHIPDTFLLNDDSPILRIVNGVPTAYGSPWSGKTPTYRNEHYPIAAIVRLSQGSRNKISRLSNLNALGALLPSCPPSFARDEMLLDQVCSIISGVLERVPIFHLECLPNEDAARLVLDTVFGDGKNVS